MSYQQGPQGPQRPQGYGPPPGWVPYGPPPQPPKKSLLARIGCGGVIVIAFGLFGSCMLCRSAATAKKDPTPAELSARAVEADRNLAAMKAAAEAKEKNAVETFPQKSIEIAATIKKATSEADTGKIALADKDVEGAVAALQDFAGTSIAADKQYQQLCEKAEALRKRIEPQVQKLAKTAAAASADKDLKASSISVTSTELFNAYQGNEVAADDKYKGRKLLVTGTVASVDKGAFGGLHLRLATPNEFMSTMCSMEDSEKSQLAQLSKGETVRVLCKGQGIVVGSPSLGGCTFR